MDPKFPFVNIRHFYRDIREMYVVDMQDDKRGEGTEGTEATSFCDSSSIQTSVFAVRAAPRVIKGPKYSERVT